MIGYTFEVSGRFVSVLGSFDPASPRLKRANQLKLGQAFCEVWIITKKIKSCKSLLNSRSPQPCGGQHGAKA